MVSGKPKAFWHLTRDMKGNKKDVCIYISSNWKTRENKSTAEWSWDLVTKDTEKIKVL